MARYYTSFEFAEIETLNDWLEFYSKNQNSFDATPIKDDNFAIPTEESDFPIYLEGHFDAKTKKRYSASLYFVYSTPLYWTKATKEQFEKYVFLDYRFHDTADRGEPSSHSFFEDPPVGHGTIFEKNLC